MGLLIASAESGASGRLALGESRKIASATSADGSVFSIVEGLDENLIAQLRERSLDLSDTELQTTSDYARFGTGSYADWFASKERTMFALVSADGALAALAWFGPKPLGRKSMKHLSTEELSQNEKAMDSAGWHTIVYRSYAPYRGKGLMTDFVRFAMETYQARYPGSKMWAGIFSNNPASLGLTKKLGFIVDESASDGDSAETILVKE